MQAALWRRPPDPPGVRHQEVVADHEAAAPHLPGEGDEALRVVLGQRVLDREDRIAAEPAEQQLDHAARVQLPAVAGEPVAPVAAELAGGDVERDRHLLVRPEAGPLDRPRQHRQRRLVVGELRPVAALVGDALEQALLGQELAGGAIDLGRPVQRLGEARRTRADHQEVLDVQPARGMGAATEDLDLRQRQAARPRRRPDDAKAAGRAAAAACAAAIETAIVALPPRRRLSGVPSSSIRRRVQRRLVEDVQPEHRAGR